MSENRDHGATQRRALIEMIEAETDSVSGRLGKNKLDPRVLAALETVPRHAFVPGPQRLFAYDNRPLPIGHDQTISQPFIVALMSDLAAVEPGARVLEIGTGCGYQTAILAELGTEVISIERIAELAESAAERLKDLGYDTVKVICGDGTQGWPEGAPYDAIVVTAAAQGIPEALTEQLAPGGRLVIPVEKPSRGLRFFEVTPDQELLVLTKGESGKVETTRVLPVAFVPLIPEESRKSKT